MLVAFIYGWQLGPGPWSRPVGPQKKCGAGQGSELVGPCRLGLHRPAARAAGPQARIKLKKKKLVFVYINYFFYGILH